MKTNNFLKDDTRRQLERIIKLVSSMLDIDITKNTRKREYVFGRSLFYAVAKDFLRCSNNNIGFVIDRDHVTIAHGLNVFRDELINDDDYFAKYTACIETLKREKLSNKHLTSKLERDALNIALVVEENIMLRKDNTQLKLMADNSRKPISSDVERLISLYNSLPDRLRDDVMFKVGVAHKLNEKQKKEINVIYTEA